MPYTLDSDNNFMDEIYNFRDKYPKNISMLEEAK